MKNLKFRIQELTNVEVLSRQQLKKILGGNQCTCVYGDDSTVENECDPDETIDECCGPAAHESNCAD